NHVPQNLKREATNRTPPASPPHSVGRRRLKRAGLLPKPGISADQATRTDIRYVPGTRNGSTTSTNGVASRATSRTRRARGSNSSPELKPNFMLVDGTIQTDVLDKIGELVYTHATERD